MVFTRQRVDLSIKNQEYMKEEKMRSLFFTLALAFLNTINALVQKLYQLHKIDLIMP